MPDEQRWGSRVDEAGDEAGEAASSPPPPGTGPEAAGASGPAEQEREGPGVAETPLADVAGLSAERDEYLTALQHLQADFENYRKRVQRQQEEQAGRAVSGLVSKLLPILDVLDLAQAHLAEAKNGDGEADQASSEEDAALGQARTLLLDALGKEGLERIDERGVAFDPVVHDAVSHTPLDAEDDGGELAGPTVGEVFRAGYRWRGQTLRPAMVQVRG